MTDLVRAKQKEIMNQKEQKHEIFGDSVNDGLKSVVCNRREKRFCR
jgi:hypothetical protein